LFSPPPLYLAQVGLDGTIAGQGGGDKVPDMRMPDGALQNAALIEGWMTWCAAADAAVTTLLQRDAGATYEGCAADLAPALGQLRDLLTNGGPDAALAAAKRLARRAWELPNRLHAGLHADALTLCAAALGGLDSPGGRRVSAELTAFWMTLNTEAKFSREVAEALLPKGLLLLPEVDAYLAKLLLQARSQALGDFAITLARAVRDGHAGYSDVALSLDLLGKLSAASGNSEPVLQLLAAARASSRARAAVRAGLPDLQGLKDKTDPAGFHQQV
jgi:hypothetical protein